MKLRSKMTRFGVILTLATLHFACTKTSLIGDEILPPDDAINVEIIDTVSVLTTTVKGDTARTYSIVATEQLPNYLVGRLDDPYFGETKSTAYAQTRLQTTSPNFRNGVLDSIVLSIDYDDDSTRHYGDLTQPQTLIISRLDEAMDAEATYYSNKKFAAGTVLGQRTFTPNIKDSVTILVPQADTMVELTLAPQVRIPLSSNFGNELLNNAAQMTSNDAFLDYFKGIEIKAGNNNTALLSFSLVNSGISLYYTTQDSLFDSNGNYTGMQTTKRRFTFPINVTSAKSVSYEHERNGAPIANYMNNRTDTLTFLQGTEGVFTKVSFPYLKNLSGKIINSAVLKITVANRENLEIYSLPTQLVALKREAGKLVVIEDVSASFRSTNGFVLFDGRYETKIINNVTYTTYDLNISAHVQDIMDGLTEEDAIYISTYPKAQIANRVILGGAGHSVFPVSLKITTTKID